MTDIRILGKNLKLCGIDIHLLQNAYSFKQFRLIARVKHLAIPLQTLSPAWPFSGNAITSNHFYADRSCTLS